jgi:hypothetical protein
MTVRKERDPEYFEIAIARIKAAQGIRFAA